MTKALSFLPPGWIKARLYHLLAPLAALVVVGLLEQTWIGEYIEDQTVILRFKARKDFDPPADPRIVLVGIDKRSLDQFGKYPWPRTVIADFLTNMAKAQHAPNVIAFDILYVDKSPDDQAFGEATGLLAGVITGALSAKPSDVSRQQEEIKRAEQETLDALQHSGPTAPFTHINGDVRRIHGSSIAAFPVEPVRTQSLFGFVDDPPSPIDYIRHTIPLLVRINDKLYPSLALQTLCQFLGVDPDKVEVNVGKNVFLKNSSGKSWTIPMTEQGDYVINYRSNSSFQQSSRSFAWITSTLKSYVDGQIQALPPECQFDKKVLLVGETETGLVDLGPTPVDSQSPLPYTHLNVINNVLQNDFLTFVPTFWVVIGWMLVTWPTLLRLKNAPLVEAVFVPIMILVLYAFISFAIFWKWSIQIALAWPALSYGAINFWGVVLRWQEEQQGREQIKNVFSRMLSPEVMGHLLDHPENVKMGGSERPVTILFSDIRDYTKFSEGLTPAEVVRQLNIYFERMVDCVIQQRGTLHKFIGDAIMAAWGDIEDASLGAEKDAQNAVRSALMMRIKLRELNEERQAEGLTPLRIGIGLNFGENVLAGLIGASNRSEFTVMGDPVNVASRLEGVTKEFHTDIAISESVRKLIGENFMVRRLGFIQLKGKSEATVVFEVLAEKTDLTQSKLTPEFVSQYEAAFDHFLARRFIEAEAGFFSCEKIHSGDYCVQEYLEACSEFSRTPPAPDWDGRIVMKTK